MIGRHYMLRGQVVVVRARWRGDGCPRNVLLEFPDGSKTVRPFRGLRRLLDDKHRKLVVQARQSLNDGERRPRGLGDLVAGMPDRGGELHLADGLAVPGFDRVAVQHNAGGYR